MTTKGDSKISNIENIILELQKYSGVKFDPFVVDALIKILLEKNRQ